MPTHPILVDALYDAVAPFLKSAVPSFVDSPEYAVVSGNEELAGVVLAAFGRFLGRLSRTEGHSDEVERGIAAVNALHSWEDGLVQAAIRDEFVESFHGQPEAVKAIRPLLAEPLAGEFARALA